MLKKTYKIPTNPAAPARECRTLAAPAVAREVSGAAAEKAGAHTLKIAGITPFSTVDWPGKICATVFLQGCPLRCVYCHNHQLIDPRRAGTTELSEVLGLLRERAGLLDGVVFSGGEPLLQAPALEAALPFVARAGAEVGLHTAGTYPRALEKVLPQLNWVGLDYKATPAEFATVTGLGPGTGRNCARRCRQSLKLLTTSQIPHEVRVTVYPLKADPKAQIWKKTIIEVLEQKPQKMALQKARKVGAPTGFEATSAGWEEQFAALADWFQAETQKRQISAEVRA